MDIHMAATAGAVFLALLIYRYDMYEREPWYMLLLGLGGGVLVALLLHLAWDLFGMKPDMEAWRRGASIRLTPLTLELLGQCVIVANGYSREKFSPACTGRLTGGPFNLLGRLGRVEPTREQDPE